MSRLYAIHAIDEPGASALRLATYDAHKAHLDTAEAAGVRIIMSGPLVADDGTSMIGSLFVLEAPEKAMVEAFNAADPFHRAGIWRSVTITGFIKRRG